MAEQLNTRLNLLIEENGFSELQEDLVRILQSALSGGPLETLDGEAELVASKLRALISLEEKPEGKNQPLGDLERFGMPSFTLPRGFHTKTVGAKQSSSKLFKC